MPRPKQEHAPGPFPGLAPRLARPADLDAVIAHIETLDSHDLRMRHMGATDTDRATQRVVCAWPILAGGDGGAFALVIPDKPGDTQEVSPDHVAHGPAMGFLEAWRSRDGSFEVGLSVLAPWRNRGLGTQLLRMALAEATRRGAEGLVATAFVENRAMLGAGRAAGGTSQPDHGSVSIHLGAPVAHAA